MAKKQGRQTNVVQYEERMEELFFALLYSQKPDRIIRKEKAKEWEVTTRTLDSMIRDARQRIKDKFKDQQEQMMEDQVSRLLNLINRAREKGHQRVEREALADLNKIMGLEQQKIDLTSGGNPIKININLSSDAEKSSNEDTPQGK